MTFYGVQRRNATCRHVCSFFDSTSSSTPDDACRLSSNDGPPATERLCLLPCPQHCVVTELDAWSACCGGLQTRRRRVLVGPRHGGRPCRAPMYETRRCEDMNASAGDCDSVAAQTTARRPVYHVGRWSRCEPLRHRHPVGRRRRSVSCLDELGRSTELG